MKDVNVEPLLLDASTRCAPPSLSSYECTEKRSCLLGQKDGPGAHAACHVFSMGDPSTRLLPQRPCQPAAVCMPAVLNPQSVADDLDAITRSAQQIAVPFTYSESPGEL